jgi:hypothetical protein
MSCWLKSHNFLRKGVELGCWSITCDIRIDISSSNRIVD